MRYLFITLLFLATISCLAQTSSKFFEIQKLSDNVYVFVTPRPMADVVHGNSVLIIGDKKAMVIDTYGDHLVAEAAIKEIKKITGKPVKYVITTHWHYDHLGGNRAFKLAYPGTIFISHINALPDLKKLVIPNFKAEPQASKDLIAEYTTAIKTGMKNDSVPLTDYEKKVRYPETIKDLSYFVTNFSSAKFRYQTPDISFTDTLKINLGKDTILVFHPGWGHSPDDAMVYIPTQKILVTGDIVVSPVPYAFNTINNDWIKILKQISSMENVNVIIPGHGNVVGDKKYINDVADLLGTTTVKIKEYFDKNYTQQETLKKIDLEVYRVKFAGTDPVKNWAFENYFLKPRIRNYYRQFAK